MCVQDAVVDTDIGLSLLYMCIYVNMGDPMASSRKKKNKVAFRKEKKGGLLGIFLVLFIFAATVCMFGYNSYTLEKQQRQLDREMSLLDQKLSYEQERKVSLDEFETFTHTKKYAEQVAKEKLGYVYKGEIIFQKDK